jgi:hypothetical protein
MSDPNFIARVWDFATAMVGYWFLWITTVPFVIDQGLSHKYLPKKIAERTDAWWPPTQRHRVLKWLCVFGFVVASFQAYDSVKGRLRELQKTSLETYAANRWAPLTNDEAVALRAELKKLPPARLSVLCAYAGCADLADSIFTVAHDLNWSGTFEGGYMTNGGIKPGIEIWSYRQTADARNSIADAIERATRGRLKVSPHEWEGKPMPEHESDINLIVGRRR